MRHPARHTHLHHCDRVLQPTAAEVPEKRWLDSAVRGPCHEVGRRDVKVAARDGAAADERLLQLQQLSPQGRQLYAVADLPRKSGSSAEFAKLLPRGSAGSMPTPFSAMAAYSARAGSCTRSHAAWSEPSARLSF